MDSEKPTNSNDKPMSKREALLFQTKTFLKDFQMLYGDDDLIYKRIFDQRRLAANDRCVSECGARISKHWQKKDKWKYRCSRCRRTFSPLSGTPLMGIKTPLSTVLQIVAMIYMQKHGCTAKEIHRYHGQNYSTSLKLLDRIRLWMSLCVHYTKFDTITQIDETFVNVSPGFGSGVQLNSGYKAERERPVVTMVESGGLGRARAIVVDHVNKLTMRKLIHANVSPNSTIYTDGNPVYRFLSDDGYLHFDCNHSEKIYSRNGVHVNGAEALAGLLKSKLMHVHRGVTQEYLQRYADEICWTFMHRHTSVYEAIDALFAVLPPITSRVIVKPNKEENNEK